MKPAALRDTARQVIFTGRVIFTEPFDQTNEKDMIILPSTRSQHISGRGRSDEMRESGCGRGQSLGGSRNGDGDAMIAKTSLPRPSEKADEVRKRRFLRPKQEPPLSLSLSLSVFLVWALGLSLSLSNFPRSSVPMADAFITCVLQTFPPSLVFSLCCE